MSQDVTVPAADDSASVLEELLQQLPEQRNAAQQLQAFLDIDPENGDVRQTLDALLSSITETESALREAGYAVPEHCQVSVTGAAQDSAEESGWQSAGSADPDDNDIDALQAEDSGVDDDQANDLDIVAYGQLRVALADASALITAAAVTGPQDRSLTFAAWEGHTRGIGSKLMAAMGYKPGRGLGAQEQGPVAPLEVVVGQAKAGLGVGKEGKTREASTSARKRRRAKKQQECTSAQAAAAAKRAAAAEAASQGMFGWLNAASRDSIEANHASVGQASHLTQPGHAAAPSSKVHNTPGAKRRSSTGASATAGHVMLAQQELVGKLQKKLSQLQSMAARQASNAGVLKQVHEQIVQVRHRLEAAQAQVLAGRKAASSHQDVKKLMKF